MILHRFSVLIQQFSPPKGVSRPGSKGAFRGQKAPKYKNYTIGIYFEGDFIARQNSAVNSKFFKTFLRRFLLQFLVVVVLFLGGEIFFIVYISRNLFRPIKDLYDKIKLLSEKHSESKKRKKKIVMQSFDVKGKGARKDSQDSHGLLSDRDR